jgi:hypothetical protein
LRNPLAVSWPARIKNGGGVRAQFHHVIDIAPTVYEIVGVPFPNLLNGVAQKPIEGVSMAYSFDSATAPGRRRSQYFEMPRMEAAHGALGLPTWCYFPQELQERALSDLNGPLFRPIRDVGGDAVGLDAGHHARAGRPDDR